MRLDWKAIVPALAAGIAIYVIMRGRTHSTTTESPPKPAVTGSAAAAAANPAADPTTRPIEHVTQLATPDERRAVADRIATAQTSRAAVHAGKPPSLPTLSSTDTEATKATLRAAMREALPFLTKCYDQALPKLANPNITINAKLTLTGDPDVGTLIEAHQIFDATNTALPPEFDDCLRNSMQQLELPPLTEGDKLDVTYPFVFSNG